MKHCLRSLAVLALIATPALALNVSDQVKINEVAYDPSESPEDPFEFVELYNAGSTTVFLDGAAISDEGGAGTGEGTFVFPGTVGGMTIPLAPGAYLLIVNDATGSTLMPDYEFFAPGTTDVDDGTVPNVTRTAGTGVDLQLGNTGDGVTLSDGTTTGSAIPCSEVVDGMSFETGGTGDINPLSSAQCSDPGPHAGYTNSMDSVQRCPDGTDSNSSSAADFRIGPRTPKAANVPNCTVAVQESTWGQLKVLFR
jgi:hypothetical protein